MDSRRVASRLPVFLWPRWPGEPKRALKNGASLPAFSSGERNTCDEVRVETDTLRMRARQNGMHAATRALSRGAGRYKVTKLCIS